MLRTHIRPLATEPPKVLKSGAPERSRTPNPQIRSLVLYPVELRALMPRRGQRGQRTGRQQLLQPPSQGKVDRDGLTGTVDLLRSAEAALPGRRSAMADTATMLAVPAG